MVAVDLKSLVGRLNELCRRQVEAAAGMTLSRSHYNVEIEHLLLKLVEAQGGDVEAILRKTGVDAGRVAMELTRALDRFRTGNSRAPALSPDIVAWLKEAWLIASLEGGAAKIRSGHLLAALLGDETLSRSVRDSVPTLMAVSAEAVRKNLAQLTEGSAEAAMAESLTATPAAPGQMPTGEAARMGGPLEQYCTDLTAQAKSGKVDPILGRDSEIRQIIDILTRRRQNNPILTGEAGVGKSAVVEGLALRIAEGDVPEALKKVRLMSLDLGLLQAGAGVKGEFENRLKGVIEGVKASPVPVVLFIDEAHTLIGAGGAAGQNDAANLLKPALARGELRCLAATTWAEYKKYFEKDAALTRRFQVVKVDEPSQPMAIAMLRGLVPTLEKHHGVRILDEAVQEAVRLSARYIPARQLPDKAVSLLDTSCARVGMSQASIPGPIEDRQRRVALITTELEAIGREAATGTDHAARIAALSDEKAKLEAELAALEARWEQEKALVARIAGLRRTLEAPPAPAAATPAPAADAAATQPAAEEPAPAAPPAAPEALRAELAAATAELRALQGEEPLVHPVVDGQAVAEVVETWTGIPVGRMMGDEIRTVLTLADRLRERVVGQDHALEAIAQAIRTSRAGLTDPNKPIGVFLFAGTSGTGKTETALALAELMYGGEQNMTVLNMSEFKEEHKTSLLMGSPPGYVGYGEGGVLTEAVRRRPYSVVLLDEMEKAHPGIQDVFYQVFDKGTMKDGEGRDIDFKNTVIIMTSNAGTDTIARLCADPDTAPEPQALLEAVRPDLLKVFKPAFLGRINTVVFYPLSEKVLRMIVGLQLNRIRKRVKEAYGVPFEVAPEVTEAIVARCHEVESGARNIQSILNRTLLPELSALILERLASGGSVGSVHVGMGSDGSFAYDIG